MHSLPESIHGLDAVIDNGPCGQIFTYRIQDDNSVDYVGPGDHHDGMYEYLEETLELQDLFQDLDLVATGLELTEGACPYSIRLYPSYATYEESTSGKPRTLTMIAAGFFVVFGMLLLLNDWLIRISHHGKKRNIRIGSVHFTFSFSFSNVAINTRCFQLCGIESENLFPLI